MKPKPSFVLYILLYSLTSSTIMASMMTTAEDLLKSCTIPELRELVGKLTAKKIKYILIEYSRYVAKGL